jgi:hypothetical protein
VQQGRIDAVAECDRELAPDADLDRSPTLLEVKNVFG